MNGKFIITIIALCMIQALGLEAQEFLGPLRGNHIQKDYDSRHRALFKSAMAEDSLDLPFLDDFSTSEIVPDPALWSDRQAYSNNDYCIDPPSIGVATLDALDKNGSIYAHATHEPYPFEADALTSHVIRLDYPASDSIYLSFFYQSGGLGDNPEEIDSLLLDFWAPSDTAWHNVWAIPGEPHSPFKQVLIPVKDPVFLTDGFRFRIRNLASLAKKIQGNEDKIGSVDHWNIDYVKLDRNRSIADTVLRDVAFTTSIRSVLVDYTAIPWSHVEASYNTILDNTLSPRYRNHDSISRNVSRDLLLEQPWYKEEFVPGYPTAQDLPAGKDTVVDLDWFYPGVNLERGDSGLVRFKASLRTDVYDHKLNDTLVHDQFFGSSFAYDDGSAESSYGLRGQGTVNGSVAQRFESFIPDRIGGVDLFFNQMADSVNTDYYFQLLVWADKQGLPGAVIYENEEDLQVEYSSTHPGFVRYHFEDPVDVDGLFYVGWKQYRDRKLNVGLDLNASLTETVLYANWQGFWEPSTKGPILIRPFLYDESTGVSSPEDAGHTLRFWPNPARDILHLEQRGRISLYNASGRLCLQQDIQDQELDISSLPQGIYFLRLEAETEFFHGKLLKVR